MMAVRAEPGRGNGEQKVFYYPASTNEQKEINEGATSTGEGGQGGCIFRGEAGFSDC